MPKVPPPPNLPALLPSWLLSLRADRKSDQTVKVYGDGVRFYLRWCEGAAAPLERASLRGWVTELIDGTNRPATARARQHAVRPVSAAEVAWGGVSSPSLSSDSHLVTAADADHVIWLWRLDLVLSTVADALTP